MSKVASPQFVQELDGHIEKSWDMSHQDGGASNELWSSETKAFLDSWTLKSLFFTEDWVFIVDDLIASKVSSQPLRVMRHTTDTKGEQVTEPVPEHPLNVLIAQPNEWQDYSQWMYNTVVELTHMGNGLVWHAPRSGQLITLPTEAMTLDLDGTGVIKSYTMSIATEESGYREIQRSQTFQTKHICHIRRPNPSSLLWGLSPFIPGRKSVLFNRYSQDYLNAFYLKQATPGLALSMDRNVNEATALRQLRSFEVAYQGRKNQRRTLILPKGVTAEVLTHTLSDQKLLEHIQSNRETICGLLKVPKHELSLQDAGSLGSEEYKVALRNFWEATLKPTMRFIAGALTKFFQKELGPEHFFEFDISDVEALKDDLKKKAETATAMLQAGVSVNEVRQKVWQLEASEAPGANEPFVLVPLSTPVQQFPEEQTLQAPLGEVKIQAPSSKISNTPEIEQFRAECFKQLLDEEERTIGGLGKKAVDMLVGMTETALEVIRKEDKSWHFLSTKDLPPNRVLSRKIERALEEQYEEEWQTEVARTLSKSVELGYDQQLQVVFNEKDRLAVEALRTRDENKRRQILSARGLDSFAHISKTHTERIMGQITQGVERGESITDIMRRVAAALGTPKQLVGRAETIARTETLTAVSIGQAAALDNAKEVIPGLKKAWLTAGDDRVRDSHVALDGDVVDADAKFSNGLRHPRDLQSTDPAAVINCRCSLLMLPPGVNLEKPKK